MRPGFAQLSGASPRLRPALRCFAWLRPALRCFAWLRPGFAQLSGDAPGFAQLSGGSPWLRPALRRCAWLCPALRCCAWLRPALRRFARLRPALRRFALASPSSPVLRLASPSSPVLRLASPSSPAIRPALASCPASPGFAQLPRFARLCPALRRFALASPSSPAVRPGFAQLWRFAWLWLKFPKLNALRGTSPPHPLVSLATPREQGDGEKSTRLTTCSAAAVYSSAGRQGVSKKIRKGKKPPLQIFLDVLPLPWHKLLKPGGASPAKLHGIPFGYRKRRQPPKQGREACTSAVRLWCMRSQS